MKYGALTNARPVREMLKGAPRPRRIRAGLRWRVLRWRGPIGKTAVCLLAALALTAAWTQAPGRDVFQLPRADLTDAEFERFARGRQVFQRSWVVAPSRDPDFDGLGPLHSRLACVSCHPGNGRGLAPADERQRLLSSVVRIGLPLHGEQGSLPHPVYGRQLSEESVPGVLPEGRAALIWHEHTVTFPDGETVTLRRPEVHLRTLNYGPADDVVLSHRVGPPLVGLGLLSEVPESVLMTMAADVNQDGVQGMLNQVFEPGVDGRRPGRFGYKSNVASLRTQNANAMLDDLGITSSVFPDENCTPAQTACLVAPSGGEPELTDMQLDDLTFYLASLQPPARRDMDDSQVMAGEILFEQIGCASCHRPVLPLADGSLIHPYTDMLLHDMGEGLADGMHEYQAGPQHWRTAPLWGVGLTATVGDAAQYLHDGRATSLTEAILWHGGSAEPSRTRFMQLEAPQRARLLHFLESL